MSKIRTVGVAVVAVLALGVFASSAFAANESGWLVKALGALTENAAVTTGLLLLSVLVLGLKAVQLNCSGTFDGTVGSTEGTRFDLINELLNSSKVAVTSTNPLSCTVETSLAKECGTVGESAEVYAVNLPWLTEVVLNGAVYEDNFPVTSGYHAKCPGGKENLCEGLALAVLTNEANDVLGTFTATTNEQKCMTGTGHVEGSGLTELVSKEPLAVSEGE